MKCTSVMIEVPNIHNEPGPCYFSIRLHGNACIAWWAGRFWRERIANVFRRWANRIERKSTITIEAYGPPQLIKMEDVVEALGIGLNIHAVRYLNDLCRDRGLEGPEIRGMTSWLQESAADD